MKILLLSCSTGEGHNHCALAAKEALEEKGHEVEFLDMLHMFGSSGPLSFDKILNRISSKKPEMFGKMYHAGELVSASGVTSPVYIANTLHAPELGDFIEKNGYDAVVCSHLFPMEALTYLRRRGKCRAKCYGILSDYTCIPFLAETELDAYFIPHADVKADCINAGISSEKLIVTGMPVSRKFAESTPKADARKALGLPADKKIYLIMTGGIGCGDAVSLCEKLHRIPSDETLFCVLPGRNEELRASLEEKYSGENVLVVPFTDKVALYMRASDVLLSKAGGISSSEAAVCGIPLVHTMIIPGVETLNAEFFEAHGMSFFASNTDEAARFADRLVYDEKTAEKMLEAQKNCVPADGAARIADYVTENN